MFQLQRKYSLTVMGRRTWVVGR